MKKIIMTLFVLLFILPLASISLATNGMNMISYGGQESGMGGASLGVSDNPMAMNNNPAGLTQIENGELSVGISLLMPNLKHKDCISPLGSNNKTGESNVFPLPILGYANRIRNGLVVIGLGVFAQGGMGADFRDLNTAFGTRDNVFSNIRYAKITPSVAYQLTDKVSIGAALNMGYSDMEMKFFPNTFFQGDGGFPAFAGMRLREVYSFGYGVKLGIIYSLSKEVTLGTVYTTKSVLDYDHGKITFQGPDPIGGTYAASVDGFNWPQSLGFGIGIRPNERLLIAADITWVNWNDAMETVIIKTSSSTPGMDSIPFTMDWKDQTVIALGVSYNASEKLTVRAGYNFGRNPVPAENLSPLFPAITEHHTTLGFGYKISNVWNINAAWEHAFNKSVEYYNSSAPFGPNAVDEHNQNTAHLFLTYKF